MAQTFLIFDFGTDEEAAQQARHKLEGWKQAFRLDKKLLFKFERDGAEPQETAEKGKGKVKPKKEEAAAESPGKVRLIVRLDFSDHEKLSHHRWTERLPNEEPFRGASPRVIRHAEAGFEATVELFDSLDRTRGLVRKPRFSI
jgi:hypothetical protein